MDRAESEPVVSDTFPELDLANSRIDEVRITVADARRAEVVTMARDNESGQFVVSSVVSYDAL